MTINFDKIYINETSVVAGPFLHDGSLEGKFDAIYTDFYDGAETFEDCEIKEAKKCLSILKDKSNKEIDVLLSADLTNQLIISNFTARDTKIPFMGIYSACASFTSELILAASLLNNKEVNNIACLTSGHNMSAERQYRSPVEYGAPKPKYATFTVSAATSAIVSKDKSNIKITSGTIGKVKDLGIKDCFDMGSAMAPAAAETLYDHLNDINKDEKYYDLILTGDLGKYGKEIFKKYCKKEYGYKLSNYNDSGVLVYNMDDERVLAGGSGPSCLPSYVFAEVIPKMKEKKLKKVLLLATGALMSTTSSNQKKTIPCICHAISLEVI